MPPSLNQPMLDLVPGEAAVEGDRAGEDVGQGRIRRHGRKPAASPPAPAERGSLAVDGGAPNAPVDDASPVLADCGVTRRMRILAPRNPHSTSNSAEDEYRSGAQGGHPRLDRVGLAGEHRREVL